MKAVLIIVVVVVAMALLGWLTFSWVNDRPSVTANPDVMQQDFETTVEAGQEAARELSDEVQRTDVDINVDRQSESP